MYRTILLLTSLLLVHLTLAQSGFDTAECGKSKHCTSIPANCHQHSNDQCQYMISYEPFMDGKSIIIELFGMKKPANQYVAVGFSEDAEMGGEPVTACAIAPNGRIELSFSYNNGKTNQPNVGVDSSDVELLDSVATDNVIYCKFRELIAPNNDALPNFNTPYQLLVAQGPRKDNGQLGYHFDKQSIPDLINFMKPLPHTAETPSADAASPRIAPSAPGVVFFSNQTSNHSITQNPPNDIQNSEGVKIEGNSVSRGTGPFSLTSETKLTLVKYHGFLMLLAWFAMIAIGIFSARYLRPLNTKVGGLHLWFQLHRGINFIAILIILAASVLIFVGKDLTWTGPLVSEGPDYNWNPGAIHTVFGIVAIILALMQPLGALARCSPDHPRRPLFNWGHRSLGLVAIIFALIASYIAINRFPAVWSDTDLPTSFVLIYIVAAILLIIVLEVLAFSRARSRRKVTINGMEMSSSSKYGQNGYEVHHSSTNERSKMDKLVNICGFILFGLISIAFVVLLTLYLL